MARLALQYLKLRRGRTVLLVAVAIVCLGWGLYSLQKHLQPAPQPNVRLAAGSTVTRRYQIIQCLAESALRHGLPIDAIATGGFEDSIEQLHDGRVDVAAVSSGLQLAGCENVRLLAGLDVAPLHILARRELVESGQSLTAMIRGHRVNLGPSGTNDRLLSGELVHFLKLQPRDAAGTGDFDALAMSKEALSELADQLNSLDGAARKERLKSAPDVVMTIGSLPGMVVQHLLSTDEYCLVPFPYARNFLTSDLDDKPTGTVDIDRFYVEATTIPAAMYVGDSPSPAVDLPTVGLRTVLVARADLSASTAKLLMESVFETDFTRRIHPVSPREIASSYDLHAGAAEYLDRNQPLFTGQFFDSLSSLFSIFGAFTAGALSLYGYLRRRRIRRPGEYLDEIRKVDLLATGLHTDSDTPATPAALASHLDSRLVKLKEQLIHDYCDNRVQGEMVLMSILSMLADSRTQLHRSAGLKTDTEGASIQAPSASKASEAASQNRPHESRFAA